jgi:hypothetical protein
MSRRLKRRCRLCGVEFCSTGKAFRYCRPEHAQKAKAEREKRRFAKLYRAKHPLLEKLCPQCNRPFEPKKSDQKFCSMRCLRKTTRARYILNHPEKAKAFLRAHWEKYRSDHPDVKRAADHRRRARQRSAFGKCSASDFSTLRTILGNACLKCGSPDRIHWDHIIPLAAGGSDGPLNKQPVCVHCNSSKQHRSTSDYRTPAQVRKLITAFQLELL